MRRARLTHLLDRGAKSKLTLVSAPAGFGKTTLVAEWAAVSGYPVAWLSLDERDSDPANFLTYLVAALRTVAPGIAEAVPALLQSSQPPPLESLVTILANDLASFPEDFILVLDDYHVLDSQRGDEALAFLLDHLPPRMHVVIATREDPRLPLARLRARAQLTEVRAADLRFTAPEADEFLARVMGLDLSAEDMAALENRTEGWIAGLQMAAISLRGLDDPAGFIRSFTGSHRFVLDYLLEEVLLRQPAEVQGFLLRTSVLDRLCGPLCDAVLESRPGFGEETLRSIERANLFVVPLDDERCWYRYHHLFGDLLGKRLRQTLPAGEIDELHRRASTWYEQNGHPWEAFRHATVAADVGGAARLIEANLKDLRLRTDILPILDWLTSLPKTVLDARPLLWVRSATLALMILQTTGVEERLQAAEDALTGVELDETTRDLVGQIAGGRATLALTRYDIDTALVQASRALDYLHPENSSSRFTAYWALTHANLWAGDRAAAIRLCAECVDLSRKTERVFSKLLAAETEGKIAEWSNRLHEAAESYQRVLQLAGGQPLPNAEAVHLGLANIHYQWNDLDAAERHAEQSRQLARLYDRVIDRHLASDVFLARIRLARGDIDGAAAMLAEAHRVADENGFALRLPQIIAARVLVLLRQGKVAAAAQLASQHGLVPSQARVLLAQHRSAAASALLEPVRHEMRDRGWVDKWLRVTVLQAVALGASGESDSALRALNEALEAAEPGGFIRLFVDEGPLMIKLLEEAAVQDVRPGYVTKLLKAMEAESTTHGAAGSAGGAAPLTEPLSARELEILQLVSQGLSNQEIGDRLFLALDTVKGHNRRIFDKLRVKRRTEAVARARELGLL